MTDYNDGEWHIWKGGECPVHPESVVEIRLRVAGRGFDGKEGKASAWVWDHDHDLDFDIICFRVVKAHREPRVWWVNVYPHETSASIAHPTKKAAEDHASFGRIECVKVQQVIE